MEMDKTPTCSHIDGEIVARQLEIAEKIRRMNLENPKFKDNAPKFFVLTLGCQQNEADSERIAGLCDAMGYSPAEKAEEADIIFVNTCAIREHAEIRALSLIGEFSHAKEKNPDLIIGVGGCMVTQGHRKDKLKNSYPYVSFVFDTGSLYKIPELVLNALSGGKRKFINDGEFKIAEGIPTLCKTPHKAWLSVMYGCNNFCSYCIVPYVRGRERSRNVDDIIGEAKILIANGAKDITLLGQNVNSYGKDIPNGDDFAGLVRKICALDGDFRLRFMTSHPKDVSDGLIDVIAEEEKVAKHFHLPAQSGSDGILKAMNRHYDVEKYMSIVEKLKSKIPDITLTTDLIVGFPGESEEDFQLTLDLVSKVGYDAIFTFIYSPRIGTPAARMENQIPKDTANRRYSELCDLAYGISLERNRRFLGKTLRVLCEEVCENDSSKLTGRADSPRPIHFTGDRNLIGKYVNVKITEAETFSLCGEITD